MARILPPTHVAVSFDDEHIVLSAIYLRRDAHTGEDFLTGSIMSGMEFAAQVGAEFHILEDEPDNGPHTEGYYRG